MLQIAKATTQKLAAILASRNGVAATLVDLSTEQGFASPAFTAHHIISQNVATELSERSAISKYPLIYVYCSKVANELRELSY